MDGRRFPRSEMAYLSVYGFRIEIVALLSHNQECPIATNLGEIRETGIGHFFSSSNVDAVLAELNRRGVKTFVELGSYHIRYSALYHSRQ